MVSRTVYSGTIGEALSCENGLFLIKAEDAEGEQARVVLTAHQVVEHIEALKKLIEKAGLKMPA